MATAAAIKQKSSLLAGVVKGKQRAPIRVLIYGEEKIGKTTFAAGAPKPIILAVEDGTGYLDVERLATPTWPDVLAAVKALTEDPHDYKTVVIDTLDRLEQQLHAFICDRDKMASIEDYGFGKGYPKALKEWIELFRLLDELRRVRGMNIVLIAHSHVKAFSPPDAKAAYDRYEMKLHPKTTGAFAKEWVDNLLFARLETFIVEDKRSPKAKAVSNGVRVIHTVKTPAYDAGTRCHLPDPLPLDWSEFSDAMEKAQPSDPVALTAAIKETAAKVGGEDEKKAVAAIERAKGDAQKLSQLNNWITSKLPKEA